MTPEQLLARHLEVQHASCWIVQSRAGGVQCGLYCDQQGEHLDYVPGEYLAMPPLLSPLGRLRWAQGACPVCSRALRPQHSGSAGFLRWESPESGEYGLYVWQMDGGATVSRQGVVWRFSPCGCVAFETTS